MPHGKSYRAALSRRPSQPVQPKQALELVKSMSTAKFDETVEAAFNLGVDPRQADQIVRGTVVLPAGTGKKVRVAAFAQGDKAREAEAAGADLVGGKELVAELAAGRALDFDVAVSTPDLMAEVGKLGRILGPRGLMPNPKAGTVTMDVGQAVTEFKGGRVEYRTDKAGNLQTIIGKVSFSLEDLEKNLAVLTGEIVRSKPSSSKGRYIKSLTLSSTMGPGIEIDLGAIEGLVELSR